MVKNTVLSLQWLGLLPWHRFDPWPRNFYIIQEWQINKSIHPSIHLLMFLTDFPKSAEWIFFFCQRVPWRFVLSSYKKGNINIVLFDILKYIGNIIKYKWWLTFFRLYLHGCILLMFQKWYKIPYNLSTSLLSI